MTLVAGTRLGPYTVVAPLGAGGMGEVYRARDPRLGREVAVKVLPAAFAGAPDRLRRFEQEARAAGQLNHPNLLAVYDVGTHEGSPYIVSELLEGETLRERLLGTALPVRKAVEYALQIARGLAAAHGKGIVHRDLKPENLFVTRDGRIKILDFGLAKLVRPESGTPALAEATTLPVDSEPGTVLGTVGYMSPEQVRGEVVDQRADIFSCGAILYEMLSGQRAFRRDSAAETMTAILKEDPPELAGIQPGLPSAVERIVAHCLEKKREERFQSTRDLAFALEALSGGSISSTFGPAPAPASPRRRRLRAVAVGVAALLLAGAMFWFGLRSREAPIPKFQRLTFQQGPVITARFAPDGQTVLYTQKVGADPIRVFSTRLASPESSSLPFPAALLFAVSPSGELAVQLAPVRIEAFQHLGTLARTPMAGAAPREVLERVLWADWGGDGQSMLVVRDVEGRARLEFPVGRSLHQVDGWISNPRVSPRGDEVAFIDHPQIGDDRGSVVVVDGAGLLRTLSSGWISIQGLAWSPKRGEVWFTAAREGAMRGLYAVARGGRERLITRVAGILELHDIAADGRALLTQEQFRVRIACLIPGETEERDLSWLDVSLVADISDDGRMILFGESGEGSGASYDVYVRRTDGSPPVRLGEGFPLDLSPDGRWALVRTNSSPPQLVLLPTGPGEPRQLSQGPMSHYNAVLFPDGRRILFMGNEPGKEIRCYVQDLEGGEPRPVAAEGNNFRRLQHPLSADGKLIALRDADGRVSIWPLDGKAGRPVPGLAEEAISGWTPDGLGLHIWEPTSWPVRVERLDVATGRRELWREITSADPSGLIEVSPLIMTPDGKSYVYSYSSSLSDLFLAEGLR